MRKAVEVSKRNGKIEVVSPDGDVLAWCFIGDDENVERIADLLSTKRLPDAAMKMRKIAQDARRVRSSFPQSVQRLTWL